MKPDVTPSEHVDVDLTRRIIGAAFEVHKHLGHGFLEQVYSRALTRELTEIGFSALSEAPIEVRYKGEVVGTYYADILVNESVICEIKATRVLVAEHEAQLLHYLKATGIHIGLLLNFGSTSVQVKRMVW